MRINLLLILSLQDEDDLYGYQVIGVVLMREHKLGLCINRQLSGIL